MNAFEATVKINEGRFGVSPLHTLSVLGLTGMRCVSAEHTMADGGKLCVMGLKDWQTCNF